MEVISTSKFKVIGVYLHYLQFQMLPYLTCRASQPRPGLGHHHGHYGGGQWGYGRGQRTGRPRGTLHPGREDVRHGLSIIG